MLEIARPYPHLLKWSQEHNILGWDNFLEGRISASLLSLQQASLTKLNSPIHIKTWSTHFIQCVLDITHQQWLFRNTRVHIRLLEGETTEEHNAIMEEVLDQLSMSPGDIFPQHRHLLDVDFSCLGEGTTIDRQYWMASLDSAVKAAANKRTRLGHGNDHEETGGNDEVTAIDQT